MPELMSFSAVKKDKTAFVAQSVRVPESGGFFLYRGDWNSTPDHAAVNELLPLACFLAVKEDISSTPNCSSGEILLLSFVRKKTNPALKYIYTVHLRTLDKNPWGKSVFRVEALHADSS